jgi:hypothetical protein
MDGSRTYFSAATQFTTLLAVHINDALLPGPLSIVSVEEFISSSARISSLHTGTILQGQQVCRVSRRSSIEPNLMSCRL